MEKKTKNIIVLIIILVLIVCLAFTISGKEPREREVVNFNMPNALNRRMPKRNKRFDWQEKNSKTDVVEDSEKTTETTIDDGDDAEIKKNCDCQKFEKTKMDDRNTELRNAMENVRTKKDNTIRTVLIIVEAFLLGGAVMFLILNNIKKETKEEKNTTKNKTRRID